MSVLTQYIFNPTEKTKSKFAEKRHLLGLDDKDTTNCTIGVQVRRSDKSLESVFQPLSKYMILVEELFRQCEANQNRKLPRKIFLATDDVTVTTDTTPRDGDSSYEYTYDDIHVDQDQEEVFHHHLYEIHLVCLTFVLKFSQIILM